MSYFIDDDAAQIRQLKDKIDDLQSLVLASQFSVSQENVESGQSTFPIANPSARGGGGSGGAPGGGLSEPLLFTINTLNPQTPPTKTNINAALGNVFEITLDRNIEFDIINPNAAKFQMLHIVITQDAATPRTITWPGSVNGTPAIDTALGSETTVSIWNKADGSWRFVTTKGGVIGGSDGANKTLSNLDLPTSVNQSLLPDALSTRDLGSELLPWRIAHVREIEFPVDASVPSVATDTQISKNPSGNMAFNNAAVGGGFQFYFEGVNKWSMTPTSFSGDNIILQQSLTLNDSETSPTINGEFRKNGIDVEVFSGNALRNLSNIGVAAGGASVFLDNLSSPTSINQSLIPDGQRTRDLGSALKNFDTLWIDQIKFDTHVGSSLSGTSATQVDSDSDNLRLNAQGTAKSIGFFINGSQKGFVDNNGLEVVGTLDTDQIQIDPTAITPAIAGHIVSDGTDVLVYSGGAVRNLSNIGGGSSNTISQLDSSVVVSDTGAGSIVGTVDGNQKFSVSTSTFNIDTDVTLGFNSASDVTFNGSLASDVIPNDNGFKEIGDSTHHLDDVFSETYTIRGTGGKTSTTERYVTADASNIILQTVSGDGLLVKSASNEIFEVQSGGTIVPKGDIDFSLGDTVDFNGSQSTVGAEGFASAIPGTSSNPTTWIVIKNNGTEYVIPAFAKS